MSPVALAAAAGVTDSAIHQLEQGLTKRPSFETALRIADALGVTPHDLAGFPASRAAPTATDPELLVELPTGGVLGIVVVQPDPSISLPEVLAQLPFTPLREIGEIVFPNATPPAAPDADEDASESRSTGIPMLVESILRLSTEIRRQAVVQERMERRLQGLEESEHLPRDRSRAAANG